MYCRGSKVLMVLVCVICGCSDSRIDFTGVDSLDFHGVTITLPEAGKGHYAVSPNSLEFTHDSLTITLSDSATGTIEIYKNGELVGTAVEGQHVQFDDEGNVTVREGPDVNAEQVAL